MEINGKVLILDDSDIQQGSIQKDEITQSDLRPKSQKEILNASMCILNLKNGRTILLKNDKGRVGVAIPQEIHKDFTTWLDIQNGVTIMNPIPTSKPKKTTTKKKSFWSGLASFLRD